MVSLTRARAAFQYGLLSMEDNKLERAMTSVKETLAQCELEDTESFKNRILKKVGSYRRHCVGSVLSIK